MIGVQELLVAFANVHKDTPVVVDAAGNGKSLIRVATVEIKDGRLVIGCSVPVAAKPVKGAAKTTPDSPKAEDEGIDLE